jgi:hypothetical protein
VSTPEDKAKAKAEEILTALNAQAKTFWTKDKLWILVGAALVVGFVIGKIV